MLLNISIGMYKSYLRKEEIFAAFSAAKNWRTWRDAQIQSSKQARIAANSI
jgi:hypothetical protein